MRLPHGWRDRIAPYPIQIAEPAVSIGVGLFGSILLPQQEQRHTASLQLPVHNRPVRQRPCRLLLERWRREQPALELGVVHPFRHRPGDADDGSRRRYSLTVDRLTPMATAICRSLTPRACRSLRTSRTFRIGALSAGIGPPPCMAAKRGWSAIRSPTLRASRRYQQGGRLQSEWVADFRRNRWPDCVGFTGRLASDYAFYPGSRPGECTNGAATSFEEARVAFEAAWCVFLSKRNEVDFQAWRDQRDWTAEKYRRFDRGERMPADWRPATA